MRMWMVPARWLCRQHLLGEHKELHMLYGCIIKGKSLKGYIEKGLIQTGSLTSRHNELVLEMEHRGYNHKSPLPVLEGQGQGQGHVNKKASQAELIRRCPACRKRITGS